MTGINDKYIIGSYWGSRQEPLSQIVDKVLRTLKELKDIDGQFSKYYQLGMSRKQALEKEVVLDNDSIKKLCLADIKKGELGEDGIAKNGFLIGLWTGQKDEESASLTFNVGDSFSGNNLNNRCVLSIPYEGAARTRLLQREISTMILRLMVEIWTPDYAVLTSDSLREKLKVGNEIGWITYRKISKHPQKLNNRIDFEKDVQGYWFYVSSIGSSVDNAARELLSLKIR